MQHTFCILLFIENYTWLSTNHRFKLKTLMNLIPIVLTSIFHFLSASAIFILKDVGEIHHMHLVITKTFQTSVCYLKLYTGFISVCNFCKTSHIFIISIIVVYHKKLYVCNSVCRWLVFINKFSWGRLHDLWMAVQHGSLLVFPTFLCPIDIPNGSYTVGIACNITIFMDSWNIGYCPLFHIWFQFINQFIK